MKTLNNKKRISMLLIAALQNGPQESPHLCSHPRGENQYKKNQPGEPPGW